MKEFKPSGEAGQDVFVYEQIVKRFNYYDGTFLDVGCAVPIWINNTYSLEQLGWRGLLIDWTQSKIDECRAQRSSPAICADATQVDWKKVCADHNLGPVIDYLSLDLDDAPGSGAEGPTVTTMQNILNAGLQFRAITVEHDRYRIGDGVRTALRALLPQYGYTMFAEDVYNRPPEVPERVQFEDWWINWEIIQPPSTI